MSNFKDVTDVLCLEGRFRPIC